MDPEGAQSILERNPLAETPIAKNAEELLDIREEFRQMQYSDAVLKQTDAKLPKTVRELRDALNEKVKKLAEEDEYGKKHEKNVPDISLRDQDEQGWIDIGWDREKRTKVIEKLRRVLRIDQDKAINIMHMLAAAGRDPDSVLNTLDDDKYTNSSSVDYYLKRSNYTNPDTGETVTEDGHAIDVGVLVANQINNRAIGGRVDRETANKYLLLHEDLGLGELGPQSNNYIMRFVLDDEFRSALDYEYDNELPQNLYDLGWNIMYHNDVKYGVNGEFPVLQMQVDVEDDLGENGKPKIGPDGRVKKRVKKGRYVVNQANFLRWLRDRMFYRYDAFETDQVPDYYSVITIPKGPLATVNLATMIFDQTRYFRDETGHDWDQLYNNVFIEPFDLIFDRTYAIEHQKAYDKGDDFAKIWEQWARESKFTRKINGQSMVDRAMVLPVDLKGKDSDTRVGEAILTMFLGYYNLADLKRLKDVLGEESEFFTREGWIKAAADFAGGGTAGTGAIKASGMPFSGEFFGEHQHYFDEAFHDNGTIKDPKKFLLFINPNYHEYPSQNLEKVLAQALQNAVRDKFRSKQGKKIEEGVDKGKDPIDIDSLKYAWLKAYSWIGFSGARARNNFKPSGEPSGHHQETRLIHTDAYRMKYEGFGGAGNQYSVAMFKQLSVPFFEGTLSESGTAPIQVGVDKHGNPIYKTRQMSQMEVMLKMRESDLRHERAKEDLEEEFNGIEGKITRAANDAQKTALEEELTKRLNRLDDYYTTMHKQFANWLEFNDNAMLVFAKNMIGMANPLYDRVMKAKEVDFEKFITYDGLFRGPSFNREAWQDALQSKLFTPLRYIFEANGGTQLNQVIRAPVYIGRDAKNKAIWEWKDQYLGERMIGHQVLDIETFWKERKSITEDQWKDLKNRGFRLRRGFLIRPDGKHEIDYNKVQGNKPMVYKQWMLMKLGTDLWSHIDRHSTDPLYTLEHYDNIVEAIKSLPGDWAGSEYDMRSARNTKTLFSKHQMEWLERISGKKSLFNRTFWSDIFIGDKRKKESMFGETTSVFLNAIFRGYS